MPVASMTGFARAEGSFGADTWMWEVKSVNSRGLDIRCRLAPGLDSLEPEARRAIAKRFKRGNVSVNLRVKRAEGTAGPRLNRDLFAQLTALADELRQGTDIAPPRIDGLLRLPGVLEPAAEDDADDAARNAAMMEGLNQALDALATARRDEGAHILPAIETLLAEIAELVDQARDCAATQPEALKARLKDLLDELLDAQTALPEDRLAHEAALLVAKADIREELDRLRAHLGAAGDLLAEEAAIGRRFDFLCQEFNREANTLCSKSSDEALTRIGLSLKAAVEQLREQIQNIE